MRLKEHARKWGDHSTHSPSDKMSEKTGPRAVCWQKRKLFEQKSRRKGRKRGGEAQDGEAN